MKPRGICCVYIWGPSEGARKGRHSWKCCHHPLYTWLSRRQESVWTRTSILKFNIAQQQQQQVYRWIFSLTTKLRSWQQKYVIPSIKRDICTLCKIPVFTGLLCSMGLHKRFLVLLRILLHCVHSTVGLKVVQNYCVWFLFSFLA